MKIAFVGDSYCADYSQQQHDSWLDLVLKEYNADIVCKGRGGIAQFHAYEDLLGIVDEADYIIFCITTYSRLPNRHGIPIDPSWLEPNGWNFKKLLDLNPVDINKLNRGNSILDNRAPEPIGVEHKKAIKAGELYYKDLMSLDFHRVAQKGILMQMDELMIEKKKKCIWFPCFEDELSMQSYIPKSGPIANYDLSTISSQEMIDSVYERKRIDNLIKQGNDGRFNHFNLENNKNMAKLIINIIETNNFNPYEIKMEEYFEVLR
jgi:hypothetical protein